MTTTQRWLALTVLLAVYLVGINTVPLTDPDEVFYSETAKEMIAHKTFLTPLIFEKSQFEKPPLYYWLLMGSFKVFGPTPFAARMIPALFGIFGVIGTYLFVRRLWGESAAFTTGLVLASSSLYLGMSRCVLTDVVFSVLVILSFYSFYAWFKDRQDGMLWLFGILAALAVLTKGPVGMTILMGATVAFLIVARQGRALKSFLLHPWWLAFVLIALPWYALVIAKYGNSFIDEFIVHDNWHRILLAEHRNFDRFYFYPMVMIAGTLPWLFHLLEWRRLPEENRLENLFFLSWFGVVFGIFMAAHSKLASYILPLMPTIIIPLGIALSRLERISWRTRLTGILNIVLGTAALIAFFVFSRKYPHLHFLSIYAAVFILAGGLITAGVLFYKGQWKASMMASVVAFTGLVLAGSLGFPRALESAFCDNDVPAFVEQYRYGNRPILCNKMYVRGVYFFTGNPVAVIDSSATPFWSPHPVDVLYQDAQLRDFFKDKDLVICVVKDGDLKRLEKLFSGERRQIVLSKNFKRVVAVSQKL